MAILSRTASCSRYFFGSFLVMVFILSFGCADQEPPAADRSESSPAADEAKAPAPDPQRIAGRWLRPDGGYILELGGVRDGGVLGAAYFNPNPINVDESNWAVEGSELHVYVKFDDVNYPGSYYSLVYDPQSDRLVGAYYQAVQKQTYSVEFVRRE